MLTASLACTFQYFDNGVFRYHLIPIYNVPFQYHIMSYTWQMTMLGLSGLLAIKVIDYTTLQWTYILLVTKTPTHHDSTMSYATTTTSTCDHLVNLKLV